MAAAKVAIVAKLGPSNHGAKNDEVTPRIARARLSPPSQQRSREIPRLDASKVVMCVT